jgi:hypothetical protein
MASAKWSELVPGEFFTANINMGQDIVLYQKLCYKARPFNAVHINTGNVCIIADTDINNYERVQVTFDIKPTN